MLNKAMGRVPPKLSTKQTRKKVRQHKQTDSIFLNDRHARGIRFHNDKSQAREDDGTDIYEVDTNNEHEENKVTPNN